MYGVERDDLSVDTVSRSNSVFVKRFIAIRILYFADKRIRKSGFSRFPLVFAN